MVHMNLIRIALLLAVSVFSGCAVHVVPIQSGGVSYQGRNVSGGLTFGQQPPAAQLVPVCPAGSRWDGRGCLVQQGQFVAPPQQGQRMCPNPLKPVNGGWVPNGYHPC
jgi:hypothetical protein